jgi:hypothetical protein
LCRRNGFGVRGRGMKKFKIKACAWLFYEIEADSEKEAMDFNKIPWNERTVSLENVTDEKLVSGLSLNDEMSRFLLGNYQKKLMEKDFLKKELKKYWIIHNK